MHLFARLAFGVLCVGAGLVGIDVAASQPPATKGSTQNPCSLDWLVDAGFDSAVRAPSDP